MRSSFGNNALGLRVREKISQTEFAALIGTPITVVSNYEHQRKNIPEDVIERYVEILAKSDAEAEQIRDLARISNSRRKYSSETPENDQIQAVLAAVGDRLSEDAVRKIREIIASELGDALATATFLGQKGSRGRTRAKKKRRNYQRPSLSSDRFIELCLLAESVRRQVFSNNERVDVAKFLDVQEVCEGGFTLDVLPQLPQYAEGAFALIVGERDGHRIFVTEDQYRYGCKGSHFVRHVLMHEYAHHVLHPELLESDQIVMFPVQELAKNRFGKSNFEDAPGMIEQVIDNQIEVEAECFATMLLVPWTEFIKGTSPRFLARDFAEQQREVERYARYFRLDAVRRPLEQLLDERG